MISRSRRRTGSCRASPTRCTRPTAVSSCRSCRRLADEEPPAPVARPAGRSRPPRSPRLCRRPCRSCPRRVAADSRGDRGRARARARARPSRPRRRAPIEAPAAVDAAACAPARGRAASRRQLLSLHRAEPGAPARPTRGSGRTAGRACDTPTATRRRPPRAPSPISPPSETPVELSVPRSADAAGRDACRSGTLLRHAGRCACRRRPRPTAPDGRSRLEPTIDTPAPAGGPGRPARAFRPLSICPMAPCRCCVVPASARRSRRCPRPSPCDHGPRPPPVARSEPLPALRAARREWPARRSARSSGRCRPSRPPCRSCPRRSRRARIRRRRRRARQRSAEAPAPIATRASPSRRRSSGPPRSARPTSLHRSSAPRSCGPTRVERGPEHPVQPIARALPRLSRRPCLCLLRPPTAASPLRLGLRRAPCSARRPPCPARASPPPRPRRRHPWPGATALSSPRAEAARETPPVVAIPERPLVGLRPLAPDRTARSPPSRDSSRRRRSRRPRLRGGSPPFPPPRAPPSNRRFRFNGRPPRRHPPQAHPLCRCGRWHLRHPSRRSRRRATSTWRVLRLRPRRYSGRASFRCPRSRATARQAHRGRSSGRCRFPSSRSTRRISPRPSARVPRGQDPDHLREQIIGWIRAELLVNRERTGRLTDLRR